MFTNRSSTTVSVSLASTKMQSWRSNGHFNELIHMIDHQATYFLYVVYIYGSYMTNMVSGDTVLPSQPSPSPSSSSCRRTSRRLGASELTHTSLRSQATDNGGLSLHWQEREISSAEEVLAHNVRHWQGVGVGFLSPSGLATVSLYRWKQAIS